jgi:siroheme synthase (precorrin-2 oxidase/ferrochelatase)
MNVAATTGANVAIMAAMMRKRVIEHFEKAGALSAETAIPLPPKQSLSTVNALIKHKVIVPAGEDLFYLDREADARSLREQGKAAMAVLGMLVLIGLIILGMVLVGRA